MTRGSGSSPLEELYAVQRRMNELFESALARSNFDADTAVDAWTPVCDAYRTAQGLVFCLELPGLDPAHLAVRVEAGELVVEGQREMERTQVGLRFHRVERSYGRFARRFPLAPEVRRDGVAADYRDGVLRVEVPLSTGGPAGPLRVPVG